LFIFRLAVLLIPSGLLSEAMGAKNLLLCSIGASSLSTILTPLAAFYTGWKGVVVLRVVNGLAQGGLYPSFHAMTSKWSPPNERGLSTALIFSGELIFT